MLRSFQGVARPQVREFGRFVSQLEDFRLVRLPILGVLAIEVRAWVVLVAFLVALNDVPECPADPLAVQRRPCATPRRLPAPV